MPDSNKPPQNLSPDLKQIYDRVMNTPAKGSSETPPPPPMDTPISTTPPVTPLQNQTVPPVVAPQPKPSLELNPTIPSQPPIQNAESEPFLTSAPPRPLQGSVGVKSFALGKEKQGEASPAPAGATKEEKKGMSKILIAILIGIFFVAWSFFWVVFFFNPFS